MGHARGCRVAEGWSDSKISVGNNGTRTRIGNDEQKLSPEDPNFLRKHCGGLEPCHLENTMQEGTIFLRISFR